MERFQQRFTTLIETLLVSSRICLISAGATPRMVICSVEAGRHLDPASDGIQRQGPGTSRQGNSWRTEQITFPGHR